MKPSAYRVAVRMQILPHLPDVFLAVREKYNLLVFLVVVQFAVAAVSDRRNLLNQKTAVRDRRYKESNCTTTCKKDLPAVSSGCYNHDEGWLSLRSNIGAARGSHCMKLHLIPGGAI